MTDVMETLCNKNLGNISVMVSLIHDPHSDLSYLGEYSSEPSEHAIETGHTDGRHYPYFNPANPDYAQEDFERMKAYNNGDWMMTGVVATIKLDGRVLGNGSLWGVEYAFKVEDYHKEFMRDVVREAIAEARKFLGDIPKSKNEQRFEAALFKIATAPKSPWNKVVTAYQNIAIEALFGKPIEEPETLVIFRKFRDGGDIIALFPEMEENDGLCNSYQHIGQHGAANYCGLVSAQDRTTAPATPEEYADLLEELEAIGYTNLKIRKKWMRGNRQ